MKQRNDAEEVARTRRGIHFRTYTGPWQCRYIKPKRCRCMLLDQHTIRPPSSTVDSGNEYNHMDSIHRLSPRRQSPPISTSSSFQLLYERRAPHRLNSAPISIHNGPPPRNSGDNSRFATEIEPIIFITDTSLPTARQNQLRISTATSESMPRSEKLPPS